MAFGKLGAFYTLGKTLMGHRRGGVPLTQVATSVPAMFKARITGDYTGLSWRKVGMMALALVYILSPVDLVPELVLTVLGLADDGLAIAWLIGALIDEASEFVLWQSDREGRTIKGGQLADS